MKTCLLLVDLPNNVLNAMTTLLPRLVLTGFKLYVLLRGAQTRMVGQGGKP
ncbi:MAG: hypothetical protein WBX27_08160 [Specibacter sp.]